MTHPERTWRGPDNAFFPFEVQAGNDIVA